MLQDINKPCEDNLGGLICVKFIPVSEVQSMVSPIGGKITEPITTKVPGRWYEAYGTEGTRAHSEDCEDTDHGPVINKKVTVFVPKDREEFSELYSRMLRQKFIVDAVDANGLRKIIGTLDEPLKFKFTFGTGDAMVSRNGHTIEFSGQGSQRSYIYAI